MEKGSDMSTDTRADRIEAYGARETAYKREDEIVSLMAMLSVSLVLILGLVAGGCSKVDMDKPAQATIELARAMSTLI